MLLDTVPMFHEYDIAPLPDSICMLPTQTMVGPVMETTGLLETETVVTTVFAAGQPAPEVPVMVYWVVTVGLTIVLPPLTVYVAAPDGFRVNEPGVGQMAPLLHTIVGVMFTYTCVVLIDSQTPTVPATAVPVQV